MMLSDLERPIDPSGRRSFMKLLAAAPLFATMGTRSFAATVTSTVKSKGKKKNYSNNIYTRLGVRPLINARGTWTYLTGSLELPEVREAVLQASNYFVDFFELRDAVSRQLAKISGFESGMITSGAAAAIASATAGCIAGTDPKNVWQLPDTTGLKSEVIMLPGRIDFDSAIRYSGGKLVVAKTVDELKSAITPQTAMVYTTFRDDRVADALKVTRAAGVPMLVDHAGGIPPITNLAEMAKIGVDLCCFSGGKGAFGPQCSGLLLGRKDLIDAALANSDPWEGAVCRPMKVGKEEIMGLLAALKYWSSADLAAIGKESQNRLARIAKLVETVPGVTTSVTVRGADIMYPYLSVKWDEAQFGLTVAQCAQQLRDGEPRIEVWTNSNPSGVKYEKARSSTPHPDIFRIDSMTMEAGEDLIIGKRLRQVLNNARKASK